MANYQFKPLDRVQTNKMHPVDPFRQVMPKRHLGESGITVGEIGLGTAALGRHGFSAIPDDEALYFLGCALDMEASFVDCAPTYGGGRAERLVGEAAKGRRHETVLCTKAGYFEDGHFDFSGPAIRKSLEASLQRLQTGFVDVLLLHNPPLEAINQANPAFVELEKLKTEGKIRAYGASVSGSVQIKALVEKTQSQVAEFPFNILNQEAAAAFDAAAKKRVGLVACSPLDGGRLAGMSAHDTAVRAVELAAPAGSTLSQVSLQFVLAHGALSCAVPGASDWHQVIGNVTSCQRRLSAADVAALKAGQMTKFVPRERLAPKLRSLKRQGKTVVFANGCFDLLHVGHLRYLEGAKKAGGPKGVLVVALNTDASVSRLKGPTRPLMRLKERAELISALACVDFVTSFGEPTADKTLLTLRPDIQAKGTDYTKDSVPEAALMRSIGGRIAITGDPKDHSTTALISKVKKAFT